MILRLDRVRDLVPAPILVPFLWIGIFWIGIGAPGASGVVVAPGPLPIQVDEKPEAGAETPREATDEEARQALDLYRKMIKNEDVAVQLSAIRRLGEVRHRLAVEAVAKKLRSNDQEIQVAAITALAAQDPKYATRPLLGAFTARPNQERPRIRSTCLEALGQLRAGRAVPLLIKVIRDEEEDPEVIKGAVVALGSMKEVRAADDLIKIFEVDPNDQPERPGPRDPPASYWKRIWQRWRVVEGPLRTSLEQITGQRFKDGKEAREWYEKNKRKLRRQRS